MNYTFLPASKIIESFTTKASSLRSGRVTVSILDTILVEVYGSKMHINELATISSSDANQLVISPFDKSNLKEIEKAITNSNLGVNPNSDGIVIRLVFPPMTEEIRKVKVKELAKILEETKIIVRNARQDELKSIKREKDEGLMSEDEQSKLEKDLQTEVESLNKELDEMFHKKGHELLKM